MRSFHFVRQFFFLFFYFFLFLEISRAEIVEEGDILSSQTQEALSQEAREEIEAYAKSIAQYVRKLFFACIKMKRGAPLSEVSDVLNAWPGLWQMCLPSGEENLQAQRKAGEAAVVGYCKEILTPRFCERFGSFQPYCRAQLSQGCVAGYSGKIDAR
ncbi:MAG: hypothetical protein ACRC12_04420 [Holosporales bacterium]